MGGFLELLENQLEPSDVEELKYILGNSFTGTFYSYIALQETFVLKFLASWTTVRIFTHEAVLLVTSKDIWENYWNRYILYTYKYSLGSTTERYSYKICISIFRKWTNEMYELMNELPS